MPSGNLPGGHAEIAHLPHFRIGPLLLAYYHYCLAIELSKASDHSFIITNVPVAVQLNKIGAHLHDVFERIRPVRVATKLNLLPGSEVFCNFFPFNQYIFLETGDD